MAPRIILKSEVGFTNFAIVIFFLFILCVHSDLQEARDPEAGYLWKLLKALKPAPSNWSEDTYVCNWNGVECSKEGKVYALKLSSMSLTGTIPSDLNNTLTQLNHLLLDNNSLSGPLPSLAGLSTLTEVQLDNNNFTSIPHHCFQGLSSLETLTLSNNINLPPWSFPLDLLQSSSKLQGLRLDATNLIGTLPEDICTSFPSLYSLFLSNNKLTGPLPHFSNCTNLGYLDLQDNLLTGLVPPSLMNLSMISVHLERNYFQGPLPVFQSSFTDVNTSNNGFCLDHAGPCDKQVTTLLQIAADFGYPLLLARSWRGNNPCQNWSFVVCVENKIRTLNLTKQNLTGTISPAFTNLTDLRELYLSGNNLSGPIPESLTDLPQLKILDVSNNNLSGNIPHFSPDVTLNTKGNVLLINASQPTTVAPSKAPFSLSLIAGLSAASVGILVTCAAVIYKSKRLQKILFKKTIVDHNVEDLIQSHGFMVQKRYSYSQVKKMTNSFREELGKGAFGVVYKGSLSDGRQVAVKILKECKTNGEEFINEVASINRTSHVNIVPFLGFCYEPNKRALIYEFMPNGSLDKFIDERASFNAVCKLDWNILYQVIIGIARGIEYLHWGCSTKILHLDIKPQNILLDEEFVPKIADFGLAKICTKKESIVSLQCARGTPGYIAPEVYNQMYGGVSRISHKSDVYSYGKLILVVVGGKKNYNSKDSRASETFFTDWIYKELEQDNLPAKCLMDIEDENNDLVKKIILVSMWCIQRNPSDRPSIKRVIEMLEGSLDSIPFPPKPMWYSPQESKLQSPDIAYDNTHKTDSSTSMQNDSINPNESA
ncbi:receptor-like kinase TMK4 [Arachis ipaensis]|nr:receptor-like kinase TMK4 [Arachis ipaensis]XP_020977929.1 receptor-like kinase TMK4 [Arachis ipaensis]XP_025650493.1 receptor-like kinase TMK4 [Arachis hypogaea]XP_025697225.1 receptor-like kinase TMK4 [Arachis hypogaea]